MPLVTWYLGPQTDYLGTTANNTIAALLGFLNTRIVANSSASEASWEVAQYNSSAPRSLLLRRKNNAAGRIVIFGDSLPNAAAVRGTPSAANLYIAFSASSTSNTVSDYTAGAPLAASDYIPGVSIIGTPGSSNNFYTLSYIEHADGVFVHLSDNTGFWVGGAGEIVEDTSGTIYPAILGGGTSTTSTWTTNGTASQCFISALGGADSGYTTNNACLVVRISGANKQMYRALRIATTNALNSVSKQIDFSTFRQEHFPIHIVYNTTDNAGLFGKMRQIAFGPHGGRVSKRLGAGSPPNAVLAYGLGYNYTAGYNYPQSIWFTNFEV